MLFLVGCSTTVERILSAAFTHNVSHISRRIGRGQFDHLLVQPQPLWLTLASEGFAPICGGAAIATGILIMAWAWTGLGLPLTIPWVAAFGVSLVSSVCVVLSTMFLWSVVAFWAPFGGEVISMSVHDAMGALGTSPLDGIGGAIGVGLVTLFPAGLVAWMPVRALVGMSTDPWGYLPTP
ncbi:MAG: ABC-2 family transporter protein [Chloroflexi bacterium]|nr:ABC-2 family transporter protein [Chloroflexota bacterium]